MEYTNSSMAWLIAEYVHSERDRQILTRRFIDGITQEAVAREVAMCKRQIQNVEHRFVEDVLATKMDTI